MPENASTANSVLSRKEDDAPDCEIVFNRIAVSPFVIATVYFEVDFVRQISHDKSLLM